MVSRQEMDALNAFLGWWEIKLIRPVSSSDFPTTEKGCFAAPNNPFAFRGKFHPPPSLTNQPSSFLFETWQRSTPTTNNYIYIYIHIYTTRDTESRDDYSRLLRGWRENLVTFNLWELVLWGRSEDGRHVHVTSNSGSRARRFGPLITKHTPFENDNGG